MEDKLVLQTVNGAELTLSIAGLGSRSYAFIIDWHFRLLLAIAWFLALVLLLGGSFDEKFGEVFRNSSASLWVIFAPALLIYFLYHPVLEVLMHGRTPGKRIAGIRILSAQGKTPEFSALLIRNVFRLIDSLPGFYMLGLGVALATARQVRIGDLAAGTLLVYEEHTHQLNRLGALATHSRLGQSDLELLQDILDRWVHLEEGPRRGLARKFLERIGETTSEFDSETDETIYARLKKLTEDARGQLAS